MQLRTFFLLALLSASLLLTACKGEKGDPGPSGMAATGNLSGFVRTYDEFGNESPKNGVTVTLENTTPAITAVTNNEGRYEIQNAPTSTYNISYTKAGYGTYRLFGYPHVGGGQSAYFYARELSQISTSTLRDLTLSSTPGSNYLTFRALLSNASTVGRQFNTVLFVGTSASVTSATGKRLSGLSPGGSPAPAGNPTVDLPINGGIGADYFNREGFPSGSTAYVVAYPSSGGGYYGYSYQDPATGREVYTALGAPSNVLRITVP